jgi:hypothetical protein
MEHINLPAYLITVHLRDLPLTQTKQSRTVGSLANINWKGWEGSGRGLLWDTSEAYAWNAKETHENRLVPQQNFKFI